MATIHGSAVVDERARIGNGCEIGPYCVVEEGAELGEGCRLDSHVVIKRGARLGEKVRVASCAVIGGDPQDRTFDPETISGVVVGSGSVLREGVTVNRSTRSGCATELGEGVYMMACSHAGHDCVLGEGVVLANGALLAGHVHVGAHSFVGGGAGIHQFCRIGESVMVGGNAAITKDIPPGLSVTERNRVIGLNLVGLKRRGFDAEAIGAFKRLYREFYAGSGNIRERARGRLDEADGLSTFDRRFLEFFQEGTRGFVGTRPGTES